MRCMFSHQLKLLGHDPVFQGLEQQQELILTELCGIKTGCAKTPPQLEPTGEK